jgi:protein-ribulosamine 3-kinase
VFPSGAKLLGVEYAGSSDWTSTSCISVILPDAELRRYFLKVYRSLSRPIDASHYLKYDALHRTRLNISQAASGATGRTILQGEFTASCTIYATMPSFIPKPHGWGSYAASDTYFLLSDYLDISPGLPRPDKFNPRLAELQRITPPNGMFGFAEATCDGAIPHRVAWKTNWGDFYAELLRGVLEFDTAANGSWAELDLVVDRTITRLIPRLLGVLQADGRQIKPSLIHGDLYEGNIGTDAKTGEIVVWDASS